MVITIKSSADNVLKVYLLNQTGDPVPLDRDATSLEFEVLSRSGAVLLRKTLLPPFHVEANALGEPYVSVRVTQDEVSQLEAGGSVCAWNLLSIGPWGRRVVSYGTVLCYRFSPPPSD